jgi:hypothetical protein
MDNSELILMRLMVLISGPYKNFIEIHGPYIPLSRSSKVLVMKSPRLFGESIFNYYYNPSISINNNESHESLISIINDELMKYIEFTKPNDQLDKSITINFNEIDFFNSILKSHMI